MYDLKNDEELKAAYWEAARGGAAGAAKVCTFLHFIVRLSRSILKVSKFLTGFTLPIIDQLTLLSVGICRPRVGNRRLLLESFIPRSHASIQGVCRSHLLLLIGSINFPYSFLQISIMTLGGIIEADKRLIAHEKMMRRHHRQKRDSEIWRLYKEDLERGGKEASEGHVSKEDRK